MANKSYYHRSFIILKPLTKGFGLVPGKDPGGYCKFEIRRGVGKAYIYLQDLKPGSLLDGVYEAYLLSMDEEIQPYRLAGLHIDSQGRGEYIASFDSGDMEGTGYTLEHFHGLIIVFRSESRERGIRVAYPLVGYSGRELKMEMGRITDRLKAVYGEGIHTETEMIHEERSPIDGLGERDHSIEGVAREIDGITDDLADVEKIGDATYDPVDEGIIEDITNNPAYDGESRGMEINVVEEVDDTIGSAEIDNTGMDSVKADNAGKNSRRTDDAGTDGVEAINPEVDTAERNVDEIGQDMLENLPEIEFRPLNTYPGGEEIPYMGRDVEAERVKKEQARDTEQGDYTMGNDSDPGGIEGNWSIPTYWDSVKDYFEGLFETRQRVSPFGYDSGDTKWVRVQQFMPGGYYAEGPYNHPNAYSDHYIVGLQRAGGKVKNVIYGIPSMYSLLPPTSLNGFSRWVPMREGSGMGYWLMYVDALSGKVVNPQ